jgi:hypothetical protein
MTEKKQPHQAEFLDLDKFLPPPRVVTLTERDDPPGLAGLIRKALRRIGIVIPGRVRRINLAAVTTRATIEVEAWFKAYNATLAEITDEKKAEARSEEENIALLDAIESQMFDLMAAACRASDPTITREWLQRNTTPTQIRELFQFILQPLYEQAIQNAARLAAAGKKAAAP